MWQNSKQLNKMGFKRSKTNRKPTQRHRWNKMRWKWSKEKQSWWLNDWMKVIFSVESKFCNYQGGDAETCLLPFKIKQIKWLHEENKSIPESFTTKCCMTFKVSEEMAVISSTINAQVYIEILDKFLIPIDRKLLWWRRSSRR